ncbi:hypothetical protein ACFFIX_00840 [Metabacillus herbersteinensis]|uniref:Endolytic transglycosylase MltG n=1 Tax=Metabacillus herbersteinensis TaxID=283816 RepID=A0ABV6G8K2_9BACI
MSKNGFQSFAAGMIAATSVLSATFFLSGNAPTADEVALQKEVTETDVKDYLAKSGQMTITNEEYETLIKAKDQAANKEQQKATEKTAETEVKEQEDKPVEIKKYSVQIREGMTTGEVSDLLEQNGIITSAKDFNQYLIKGNYHREVQLGTFEVMQGMSFEELTEAITR